MKVPGSGAAVRLREEVRLPRAAAPRLACLACRRPLPEAAAPGLSRLLLEALGERPGGMTTRELVRCARRRFADVQAALLGLEAEGLVERFEPRRGRGWNAKPWRLAQEASGAAWERRQWAAEAPDGFSIASALAGALGAARAATSRPARLAYLALAAALALVGALAEGRR